MSLIYDEPPIAIPPTLARVFKYNGAALLQQIHYFVELNKKKPKSAKKYFRDDRWWMYATYDELSHYTHLDVSTLKRYVKRFVELEIIVIGRFNQAGYDRTNWYTVDKGKLNDYVNDALVQNEPTKVADCPDGDSGSLAPPIPETNQKTTPETNTNNSEGSFYDQVEKTVQRYNHKQTGMILPHNPRDREKVIAIGDSLLAQFPDGPIDHCIGYLERKCELFIEKSKSGGKFWSGKVLTHATLRGLWGYLVIEKDKPPPEKKPKKEVLTLDQLVEKYGQECVDEGIARAKKYGKEGNLVFINATVLNIRQWKGSRQ